MLTLNRAVSQTRPAVTIMSANRYKRGSKGSFYSQQGPFSQRGPSIHKMVLLFAHRCGARCGVSDTTCRNDHVGKLVQKGPSIHKRSFYSRSIYIHKYIRRCAMTLNRAVSRTRPAVTITANWFHRLRVDWLNGFFIHHFHRGMRPREGFRAARAEDAQGTPTQSHISPSKC